MSTTYTCPGPVKLSVLVCSSCEAFICDTAQIQRQALPSSQLSSQVFSYELEDVFPPSGDTNSSVWCYVCSEDVRTVVSIPPEWAPAATESLLRDDRSEGIWGGSGGRSTTTAAMTAGAPEHNPSVTLETREETSRRFDVLRISAKDVVGVTVNLVFSANGGALGAPHRSGVRSEDGVDDPTEVEQSRSSDRDSWFTEFPTRTSVCCQCCGTVFGWLFQSRSTASSTFQDEPHGDNIFSSSPDVARDNEESNERGDSQPNDGDQGLRQFVGLQLRRVKLRQWSPTELVVADRRARQGGQYCPLASGRRIVNQVTAVTDADELQLRLQALRNQVSLYVYLHAKHREQSDVARQLLQSQRLQVRQNEDKVATMEQIIEAHRKQLEVQQRHMRHQDELLQNQREQIITQQRQIDVEQLLLHEQNRTIQSQLDQMRLLHATLRAKEQSHRMALDAAGGGVGRDGAAAHDAAAAVAAPNCTTTDGNDSLGDQGCPTL